MASNFDEVGKKIRFALNYVSKVSVLKEIGAFASDLIVKRTRVGWGVKENEAPKKRLAKLSDSYKKQRKTTLQKILSMSTKANKSNLTLTGQMIDSIAHSVRGNKISIGPRGAEAQQKAEWAEEGSSNRPKRAFMHLSKQEQRQIQQFIRGEVGKALKKAF